MEGEAALGPGGGLGAETASQAWHQGLLWGGAGASQAWVKECLRDTESSWENSPVWLLWPALPLGTGPGLQICRGGQHAITAACISHLPLLPTGDPRAATGSSASHLDKHHTPPQGCEAPQTGHLKDNPRTRHTGGQPGGRALTAPQRHSHTATKVVCVRLATPPWPSIDSDTSPEREKAKSSLGKGQAAPSASSLSSPWVFSQR